jgi:hypothetical protein
VRVRKRLPVAAFHSLIVLSVDPDATVVPSGESATERTREVWPVRVRKRPPVATFHSLTV